MKRSICISALISTLVLIGLGTAAAEVVMIAHPSVPVDIVDAGMIRQIYMGQTTLWNDELAIAPVVIKAGPVRNEFLKTYIKKSSAQFSTFWKKAVFSGTGTPPAEQNTESKLIAYVAATPGAIGFIDHDTAAEGVKVLSIE